MIAYPPKWLESMQKQFPAEYKAFLQALQQPSYAGLRINPLRENAIGDALEAYAGGPVPWYPRLGRYVRSGRPGSDVAHFSGGYYMQDPSAMSAVAVLAPQRGERVLDLCAAPGGKSGQIAAEIGEEGILVSNEVEPSRARMLAGNLERLGIPNAQVVSAMPEQLAAKWPGLFDAVLCDAPCSGEGMFRRDPSARSEWNERSPEGCSQRQRTILDSAVALVRPGGRLVYSTCTFNVHENEENVAYLLERYPFLHPVDFTLPDVGMSQNGCIRLWPHKISGEGHFVAMLRKNADAPLPKNKQKQKVAKSSADTTDILERFLRETQIDLGRFNSWKPMLHADELLLVPAQMPETDGIYCLRKGLPVAKIGRSHVEPLHALSMALLPQETASSCNLTEEQTEVWMRGKPISSEAPVPTKWVWMHHNNLPLGWGKASDETIKNHLPKGLWKR